MEFSLTTPQKTRYDFNSLQELFDFIKKHGELDGWIIHVHHM